MAQDRVQLFVETQSVDEDRAVLSYLQNLDGIKGVFYLATQKPDLLKRVQDNPTNAFLVNVSSDAEIDQVWDQIFKNRKVVSGLKI